MSGLLTIIIRRLIYFSGLWLLFRRFYRRKARVLMYHGICEEDIHLWTQMPLDEFERQMQYLARHYRVISLSQAVESIKAPKPFPEHSVVITFDDGFLSNKTLAYPILRRYNLPAEIFLTTSFIDKAPRFKGMIRTDYIVGLFRRSKEQNLDLRDQGLGVLSLGSPAERIAAGYLVSNTMKRISRPEENRLIGVIEERLGYGFTPEDERIFQSLSWDDIRQLRGEGLISFGAHTISHEILSRLSSEELLCEVADSQKTIETKLGTPIRHLAYPNGTRADFNDTVKETVSRYYDCALATIDGFVVPGDDPYEIKRIGIGNDMKLWVYKLELSGALDFFRDLKKRLLG